MKSPVDGFDWIVINNESSAVGAAHTTVARDHLARNWLLRVIIFFEYY